MKRVVERKQRSDKKRDVKPTINIALKDAIYRLSHITQTPVKNVAEQMVDHAINERDVTDNLSTSFRRDIRVNNTLYCGSIDNVHIGRRENGECERLTLRLNQQSYEGVSVIAYALDVSTSRVCALLLDASMRDFRFINTYVSRYLNSKLSSEQMKELRDILRYSNEGVDDYMTWAAFLSAIIDEVSAPVTRIKDAVNEFIARNWRDK